MVLVCGIIITGLCTTTMVSWIKTIFKSGIITDYLAGTLTAKPDNTIERIMCLQYGDDASTAANNVVVSIREPTQLVNSVLCAVTTPQRTSYFDVYDTMQQPVSSVDHHSVVAAPSPSHAHEQSPIYGDDVSPSDIPPFFRSSQQMVLESLFGIDRQQRESATTSIRGRVYIEYWYESTRHVMYYTIPEDTIKFPLYKPSNQDTVVLVDDDDLLQAALFVVESPQGHRRELDITTTLTAFLGPHNDFHGRTRRGVDMAAIMDYYALYGPEPIGGAPKLLPSQLIGARQRIELVYLTTVKTIT